MGVYRADGARLYYHTDGDGPPLVLIHGLGSSHQDWEYQVPAFGRHFRVIAPDLRGFGASDRAGEYSVPRFARDLWGLLDHLRVERPLLLGYSMGGAVAMQMALDRPGRVPRLVLSNTLPSFQPDTLAKRWLMWTRLLLMNASGPRRLSTRVALKLFPKPSQAELRERVARRRAQNDKSAYVATIRAIARWSVRERLAELTMPVLVLAAEHDYMPGDQIEAFAETLPNARYVCFPDTRHGLPLEAPEAYNRVVLDFLLGAAQAVQ